MFLRCYEWEKQIFDFYQLCTYLQRPSNSVVFLYNGKYYW